MEDDTVYISPIFKPGEPWPVMVRVDKGNEVRTFMLVEQKSKKKEEKK